jgi:hypothetical protein
MSEENLEVEVEVKTRISVKQFRRENDYIDPDEWHQFLEDLVCDSICPALCIYGCEVEPDGTCSHNNPSVLLALGLI